VPEAGVRLNGQAIRDARRSLLVTKAEFADLAQVGYVTLWRAERGQPVSMGTLKRIAAALHREPGGLVST